MPLIYRLYSIHSALLAAKDESISFLPSVCQPQEFGLSRYGKWPGKAVIFKVPATMTHSPVWGLKLTQIYSRPSLLVIWGRRLTKVPLQIKWSHLILTMHTSMGKGHQLSHHWLWCSCLHKIISIHQGSKVGSNSWFTWFCNGPVMRFGHGQQLLISLRP